MLVAPVFSTAGDVRYYVPAGRWTSFFTGEVIEGPCWRHETHGFMSLPLLVRPGSVLAAGAHEDRPDYDYGEGVTLQAYQLGEGARVEVEIPSASGEIESIFSVKREGGQLTATRRGRDGAWQLLLAGIHAATRLAA